MLTRVGSIYAMDKLSAWQILSASILHGRHVCKHARLGCKMCCARMGVALRQAFKMMTRIVDASPRHI